MKKLTLLLSILIVGIYSVAQVAINTDGNAPDNSAALDISSTTKGVLIPRMTNNQIQIIANAANGLLIYSTDDNKIYSYHSGDNEWKGMDYGTGTLSPTIFPPGTVNCGTVTIIQNVTNPSTGRIWMDRNIGASQVATSSTDSDAYGDLYQWGRFSDGHQCRNSNTTTTLSSSNTPGHSNFIISASGGLYDWRNPQNNNLWQGINGTNNLCPTGYLIPTEAEWLAERNSWSSYNLSGAYSSPLKLTSAGWRSPQVGVTTENGIGSYWSSTVSGTHSIRLLFDGSSTNFAERGRASGYSARCIKN